jgi:hypothetical protein
MRTPDPDRDSDSFILAGAMFTRWLGAYRAQDADAERMLGDLTADPRNYALSLAAAGEMLLGVLERLDRDGVIEGGVGVFLDRQALNYGAAADAVVAKHLGKEGK